MNHLKAPVSIAVIAYPGVQMSAVLGLGDLFTIANRNSEKSGGRQFVVCEVSKPMMVAPKPVFDVVILPPNLTGAWGDDETEILQWLGEQHGAGAVMCSVCAGAFWLGYSGLLRGRPATTHWALETEFIAAFPETDLNAERILVDDNDIVTAGGLMAWIDLGLYVVNRWLGPQVVSDTARHLLIDPAGREQRNYRSFRPILNHGDSKILVLQHWLEANAASSMVIGDLAKRIHLSDRTFLRRFKAATGETPIAYLQNLRIEKARGLLERSRIPISEIGWKVGYRDASAFSRLFLARTGLTAGAYRKRFGVQARQPVRE